MTETVEEEAVAASTEPPKAEEPKPKRAPQLRTITAIENVVNEYAKTVVKKAKWGIKDDEFIILLSGRFKGIMGLQRGHPVKITLAWPEAQPHLNTLLHEAFSTIHRHKMVDVWAIEKVAHIRARNVESKKWRREKFGELGEIIGELIPKKYITVETTTVSTVTRTIRDTTSGVEIVKTEQVATTRHDDGRVLEVQTWLELSRLVRDQEQEDALDDSGADDTVEETKGA